MEDLNLVLEKAVNKMADEKIDKVAKKIEKDFTKYVSDEKQTYLDSIKHGLVIKVEYNDVTTHLHGLKHSQLEMLLQVLSTKQNVMLVGSAGTGKTHAVFQCAEALGLPFYAMSLSPQTTKSDLLGYGDATGKYVKSQLYRAVKDGGVLVLDEIDAANAGVLVVINSLLSNGFIDFPVIGRVEVHKDFRFAGTANTFGFGADRQYVGRNQLDAATMDRFTVIDWQIDPQLEKAFLSDEAHKPWLNLVLDVREYVNSHSIRAVVSPRATLKGRDLLNVGIKPKHVFEMAIKNLLPKNIHSDLDVIFNKHY